MIQLPKNGRLVQTTAELPDLRHAKKLYLDVETTSFDPKVPAFHPYNGHRICGIAVTVDDMEGAFYAPIRHTDKRWNLELETTLRWLREMVTTCEDWVNHNVKFDAHFAHVDGATFQGRLVDTYALSMMHDTDRFGHKLKPLCRDWVGLDMEEEKRVTSYLKGIKSKDYADVPADILGEYACQDAVGVRALYKFLVEKRPEDLEGVWETEIRLTPVLWDMERKGLRADKTKLKREKARALTRMIQLADRINELAGAEYVNSSKWMFNQFVTQMGLPILAFDKKSGNPTFNKAARKMYLIHPDVIADARKKELVEAIDEYKTISQFKSLFLDPYLELMDDNGYLHPRYNQIIRTGRMSSSDPNSQQLNKKAKALIEPDDGRAFLTADASQIEFRIIIHYIQDVDAIRAYNEDPNTDFHQWVADQCGVQRASAKTLNFGMAYGSGKRSVTANLAKNPDIIEHIGKLVNDEISSGKLRLEHKNRRYLDLCEEHANRIYATYHERLPGIRSVAKRAQDVCKVRGYIFNAFGRRRHLPLEYARKAFNSIVQGCAMDFIKTRMVELSPRYNKYLRDLGVDMVANVHDEILFEGPVDVIRSEEFQRYILETLETQPIEFRVPFTWNMGVGISTWAEAVSDEAEIDRESLYEHDEESYDSSND